MAETYLSPQAAGHCPVEKPDFVLIPGFSGRSAYGKIRR
jgi:hypothetical protein